MVTQHRIATGRETLSRPISFERAALVALMLAAMLLRFYRLAAQDIWGDEAFSIFLSGQPLAHVIAGGADTHPPFYPALLFFWLRLVGENAFATRALSALIGVLAVPLIFVLAKKLANARVAFFTALLTTVSPLLIYYSQETRMYELVTVLALGSAYLCVGVLLRERQSVGTGEQGGERLNFSPASLPHSLSYLAITALAMYTHYSAFYVWVAQNIFAGWLWVKSTVSLRHMSLRGAADQVQGVEKTVVEMQTETAQQDAQATKQHLHRTQVQVSHWSREEIASSQSAAPLAGKPLLAMTRLIYKLQCTPQPSHGFGGLSLNKFVRQC